MKKVAYTSILYFCFFFLLNGSCLQAGLTGSKPKSEEEAKKTIHATLSPFYQGIVPIHQEKETIKTKSQKPTAPKPQQVAKIDIYGEPIEESFEGEEETVFKKINPGMDGRVQIDETDIWPNSVHGVVFIRFKGMSKDSYAWGTGILVAPNVVLTAAHNLYSHKYGAQAETVRFLPAMNGKIMPFHEPKVIDFYYPKAYKKDQTVEDYGVLILNPPLGDETGYFGLSVLPSSDLEKLDINVTGYPGDKVVSKTKSYELWGMKGKAVNIDKDYISYEIDTNKGQSGSGVWYQDGEDYFVVGIHVKGDAALGTNCATLLTESRYNRINKWLKKSIRRIIKDVTLEGVREVDLNNARVGNFGVQELAECCLPNLTSLHLAGNVIGDEGLKALALGRFVSLQLLDIGKNRAKDEGVRSIIEAFTSLTKLDLSNNLIGDDGAISIAQALDNKTPFLELTLAENHIGGKGLKALGQALKNNVSLKRLDLGNSTEDFKEKPQFYEGVITIAEALENNTSLTQLSLRRSVLYFGGIKAMGQALRKNNSLMSLDLSKNELSRRSKFIFKAMKHNTSLTLLDLGSCKIGYREVEVPSPEGGAIYRWKGSGNMKLAAKVLRCNNSLKTLNLSNNRFFNKGACLLARALEKNTSLTHLDLRQNSVGEKGACAIAKALEKNHSLNQLLLVGNFIKEEILNTINQALERNKKLAADSSLALLPSALDPQDREKEKIHAEEGDRNLQLINSDPQKGNPNNKGKEKEKEKEADGEKIVSKQKDTVGDSKE